MLILVFVIFLAGAVVYTLANRGTVLTLSFTAEQLQSMLQQRFPVQQKDVFITTTFSDPRVMLQDGSDRIGLQITATVTALGRKAATGNLLADGQIAYVPAEGTFYFENGRVLDIQIAGLPEDLKSVVQQLADPLIDQHLKHVALYRLKPEDTQQALVKTFLKSAEIKNGRLVLQIGVNP